MRLAVLLTHPVQYYSPWFAHMAGTLDVTVFYAIRQTASGQAAAGFGVGFDWDLPLLEGYRHVFLDNVARKPQLAGFFGCDTPGIADALIRGGFDAFLTFGWNKKCYVQGLRAAWRAGIPAFIRVDSQLASGRRGWWRMLKRPLYRLLLPRLGNYIVPGKRSREYLRHYDVPDDRIFDVPHMVDTERFTRAAAAARADGENARLRARLGIADDAFVFLFVAKFLPVKRPSHLIEAFHRFVAGERAEGRGEPVLVMAGDGPLRAECESLAAALGLPVRFPGFVNQSDMPVYLAAADCLVLPSTAETWGMVVNEAFACGIPVAVSTGAGAADVVEENRTGWVFDPLLPGDMERALSRAVSNRSDEAAISQRSRSLSYDVGTAALVSACETVTTR
ncbi:MAG: glycosyltransferase family 4 protein [Pseudomonadota bacterium]|nr:glycosyltransferase family 4 protein [Pseudomonadota bacterium]